MNKGPIKDQKIRDLLIWLYAMRDNAWDAREESDFFRGEGSAFEQVIDRILAEFERED